MPPFTRYPPSLPASENVTEYGQPTPVNDIGATYKEQCRKIINCEYLDAWGGSSDTMYYRQTPTSSPWHSWGLERCLWIHQYHCRSTAPTQPWVFLSDSVAACLQSLLSTAVVTALLQIFKGPSESLQTVLYPSIVFNLGAATCAALCLFMLADFMTKACVIAATKQHSLPMKCLLNDLILFMYIIEDREWELLWGFGLGRSWSIAKVTMNYCFLCGMVCTFVGLGIGVWYKCINYSTSVITTTLVLVGRASGIVFLLLITGW